MHNISDEIAIIPLRPDGTNWILTAGTDGGVINSDEVDTNGYDGCMFVHLVGVVAASGVLTTTVQNSATAATYGSGTVDQIGSSKTNSSAGNGDGLPHIHDVYKPKRRYLRMRSQRTGGNVTINGTFAVLYKGVNKPPASTLYDMLQKLNSPEPSAT